MRLTSLVRSTSGENTEVQEHQKLKAWREKLGLDHEELGQLIGYSRETVYWMERGETPPRRYKGAPKHDRVIDPWVWQRFKMACAGLAAQYRSGRKFNW
jgi:DNA-binding XRE family transcriptional regulator